MQKIHLWLPLALNMIFAFSLLFLFYREVNMYKGFPEWIFVIAVAIFSWTFYYFAILAVLSFSKLAMFKKVSVGIALPLLIFFVLHISGLETKSRGASFLRLTFRYSHLMLAPGYLFYAFGGKALSTPLQSLRSFHLELRGKPYNPCEAGYDEVKRDYYIRYQKLRELPNGKFLVRADVKSRYHKHMGSRGRVLVMDANGYVERGDESDALWGCFDSFMFDNLWALSDKEFVVVLPHSAEYIFAGLNTGGRFDGTALEYSFTRMRFPETVASLDCFAKGADGRFYAVTREKDRPSDKISIVRVDFNNGLALDSIINLSNLDFNDDEQWKVTRCSELTANQKGEVYVYVSLRHSEMESKEVRLKVSKEGRVVETKDLVVGRDWGYIHDYIDSQRINYDGKNTFIRGRFLPDVGIANADNEEEIKLNEAIKSVIKAETPRYCVFEPLSSGNYALILGHIQSESDRPSKLMIISSDGSIKKSNEIR